VVGLKKNTWIFKKNYNNVSLKSEKNNGYLREYRRTFMIIFRYMLLKMRNVSDRIVEEMKTHYMPCNIIFSEILPFMRYVETHVRARKVTDNKILQRVRFACWITKTAYTHSTSILLLHGSNGYANATQCYVTYIYYFDYLVHEYVEQHWILTLMLIAVVTIKYGPI
jgi:hypothetical protein